MPVLSWRAQRQLTYFGIFSVIVFIIVFALISYFRPAPTCFDKTQNQNEEGVDCGGTCKPCLGEIKDIVVLWTRFFEISPSYYDVAVLVENPNLFAGSPVVHYEIKLHDEKNILVALGAGTTFINPQERFIVFESGIKTANRVPAKVSIEFSPISWERREEEKPQVSAFQYSTELSPTGRIQMTLRNENFLPEENLEVSAALLDENGNAFAVSRSRVEKIAPNSVQSLGLTWPFAFPEEPSTIQTFIRRVPKEFLESEI